MNHMTVGHSGYIQAQAAGYAQQSDMPVAISRSLVGAAESIEASVHAIEQAHDRLVAAVDRLIGGEPHGVNSASQPANPTSLESRLNSAGARAMDLANQLHALADRFDKAI